ncbi:MAG: hypothetical protein ACLRPX_10575 [Ruthenibacterium sp.]
MEYRKLPKGTEEIGIIGLGNSSLGDAGEKEAQATVELALENGVNYFDMAAGDARPFAAYGRAVAGSRSKVITRCISGPITAPANTAGRWSWRRFGARWPGSWRR